MDHGLKCEMETVNFQKNKVGENIWGLGLGKKFLNLTSIAQSIKGKTDKWNCRIESFAL